MVNVILAGGGTAGHTSPLIATAQAIQAIDAGSQITCIGTARGLETRVVPEAGLELELVPAVPLPRKINAELFKVPIHLVGAVRQAKRILRDKQADVVCGFGGYASLPAYLAARSLRIPVVIHEQNALPGLANRVASRFARAVLTSFPDTPLAGARFEGLPVRESITELARVGRAGQAAQARQSWGLQSDLPVLLVSGGSQGARRLNEATWDSADRLLAAGIQVLHIWGPKNFHDGLTERSDDQTGAMYVPVGYVDQMERAYAASDVMLGRSGAGTVAEVATVGMPAIMVPLPIGNGEQARNARPLVEAGAVVCIADGDVTADRLVNEVRKLFDSPGRLESMSQAAQKLMRPGAAGRVAQIVLDAARGGRH